MKILKHPLLLIAILLFVHGCNENDEPKRKTALVEATYYRTFQAETLRAFIEAANLDLPVGDIQYDAEAYKIIYRTHYKNREIQASGLVILPIMPANTPVGMVSFQHGTIVAHADAPSQIQPGDPTGDLYAALATPGFIVVVPDYIGFGASTDIPHPYYVEEPTATAVIDNVKAAKEFAAQKGVTFNDKLYLAGYSQGGYATLATHKFIESEGLQGFDLQASFPAAGGYDVKAMQEYFFGLENYHEPFYIAYVAHAYTNHYDWSEPYTNFFNEPYAGKIPALFDGSKSASQINAALTQDINSLINSALLNDIDQPQFVYINNAFIENSLTDWTPTIPVYFYHGDADITVPYENSVITYNQLIQNGADPAVITLTTLPGADHGSGIIPYLENCLPVLISLK